MSFDKPQIHEVKKEIKKRNPISGHEWIEYGDIVAYEVTGGGFVRTKHKLLKYAEQEKALREHMLEKYPFLNR